MENTVKSYIDLLEGLIDTEASRSSACKTWTISMLTGFILLCKATETTPNYLLLIVPILIFAGLDAYYLGTENWYRNIYNKFVSSVANGNYSEAFIINKRSWWESISDAMGKILSPSVAFYYLGMITASVILFFMLNYGR